MLTSYVSSDESTSESEQEPEDGDNEDVEGERKKKKVLKTKKLTWRSQELDDLMKQLDRKIQRRRSQRATEMMAKRKEAAAASARLAPPNAPAFAIRH